MAVFDVQINLKVEASGEADDVATRIGHLLTYGTIGDAFSAADMDAFAFDVESVTPTADED